MNPPDQTQMNKSVRRHIGVSVVCAVVVALLALTGIASPGAVVLISLLLATIVFVIAMHLYREKRAVQAVMAFTVFFVAEMLALFIVAVDDLPHGAEIVHYDTAGAMDEAPEDAH